MIGESISADVRVIVLPGDRLAEAVGVPTGSFQDNPNFVDLFPDEKIRALPHVQRAGLRPNGSPECRRLDAGLTARHQRAIAPDIGVRA